MAHLDSRLRSLRGNDASCRLEPTLAKMCWIMGRSSRELGRRRCGYTRSEALSIVRAR